MIHRCTDPRRLAIPLGLALLCAAPLAAAAGPLLTGVVEDGDAQTIEMPSLPGSWQRRVEWMAPEGTPVAQGEVVVRLDPGDLIVQVEQARTDLEKKRLSAQRRINELKLLLMDAEQAVAEAESAVAVAELDAGIPVSQIPRLDYDRYQLTLQTARKSLIRAEAERLNRERELTDVERETTLEIEQAQSHFQRMRDALAATEIRAEKAGFLIYASNPWTGRKVFPGETLFSGFQVASVASREDLEVRFWIHEADIRRIETGLEVIITADSLGQVSFPGRISWISNQAVEKQDWSNGGYFEAVAEPLATIPTAIMPGMSVLGEPRDGESGS